MATRIAQIGWEQGLLEADAFNTSITVNSVSTVKARTGLYSLAMNPATSLQGSYGKVVPSLTEIRAYTAINHNGTNVGSTAISRQGYFFYVLRADGVAWRFGWHKHNALYYITNSSSNVVASSTDAIGGIASTDVWHDISIAIKVDGAAGWLKMYVNGVEVVSFTGNTGTNPIVAVMVGGSGDSGQLWNATAYFDDFYVDDTTGEAAAMAEPRKFYYAKPNGNGASSQFTGSDSNSVDNYLMVDEIADHDSDTTHVQASSSGLVDTYTHEAFSIPVDQTLIALIPTAQARKSNTSTDTELILRIAKGVNSDSASKDLITQYNGLHARFTALPDASTFNEANINLTEIGIVSSGAYS